MVVTQEVIDRINELARLSRERVLTSEEAAEQASLRAEYIKAYRASMSGILDNTVIKRPDGSVEKVSERKKK